MSAHVNPYRPIPRADPFAAPYWAALKRGEFRLPRDLATGQFFSPVTAIPTASFEWAQAPQGGEIASYSWVHLQPSDGYADELPYVLATVRLDAGPQLMCNIVNATDDEVAIGRRVHLVLEHRESGWVIPQFEVS